MLSSLNAYGGMSAVDLLKLFGANSSTSSSSNATSANTPQLASTGVSVSSVNDPGNAIKAILAQSQIAQDQMGTLGGGSVSSVAVAASYAVQMATTEGGSSTSIADEKEYAVQKGDDAFILDKSVSMSTQITGQEEGVGWSISYSLNSVPPVSTSDSTSDPQTTQADYFQLDLTMGNSSITVGFTVDGLGPATNTGQGYSFGTTGEDAAIQIGASMESGANVSFDLNLNGLNAAQAQKVQAAFKEAESSPNVIGDDPGFSANILA